MNFESFEKKSPENAVEHIHTKQEVQEIFRQLVPDEFREIQSLEDSDGLFFYNVEVVGEVSGETTEYMFIRKTVDKKPSTNVTTIHQVFFAGGIPVGGKTIADFINNIWVKY